MQIMMSPYYGQPDFTGLASEDVPGRLDRVSLADLLRNAFVYPPHSIIEDTKLVTFGFNPEDDMRVDPRFRFKFPDSGQCGEVDGRDQDWVGCYHRLLCRSIASSCATMRSPWLLQSGGKDSTTLAIALADVRPDTTCLTYLGGNEENEVASAEHVARTLGLRHETLVCDPGRAFDRYVELAPRMPLLTADFALMSYADLATEIGLRGGDGVIDGLGSDSYFGTPIDRRKFFLTMMARNLQLPRTLAELPGIERSFKLCFMLGTMQMNSIERVFPGSRFADSEVDELFGEPISKVSRARLDLFREEIAAASTPDEGRDVAMSICGSAGAFAKGLYTASALSLQVAYPFCDRALREWVYNRVPQEYKVDPATKTNKVLVRKHIESRFADLPYVAKKGSFRFDVRGLARQRYDQVHAFAHEARDVLPGATRWLENNRRRFDNKYHASKFYLLAVVLPWISAHAGRQARERG